MPFLPRRVTPHPIDRALALRTRAPGRRRGATSRLLGPVALGAVLVSAGCSQFGDWMAPGTKGGAPAQVAMAAAVHASFAPSDAASIDVSTQYLKRDGSRGSLGRQAIPLGTGASQAVRVPVDLATCLADDARDASAGDRSCSVIFTILLMAKGVEVDRQVIGPLRLTPGGVMQVPSAVSLFEIDRIDLLRADGSAIGAADELAVVVGRTASLQARVRDVRGEIVADRTVAWTSEAATVATVSSQGIITGVALGTTRLTASVSGISRPLAVKVIRAPAALTIGGSEGSGSGLVRSAPPGIECSVQGTTVSGSCSASFAGGSRVTLSLVAEPGSQGAGWSDGCATPATGEACTLTMDADRAIRPRLLSVRRFVVRGEGDGRGRVTGDFGIDCRLQGAERSGRCEAIIPEGAALVLRALADVPETANAPPQLLEGWGGACAGTIGDQCLVAARSNATEATVRFFDVRALTIALDGRGSGRVLANEAALCELVDGAARGACSQTATHGTRVSLVAQPGARSVFAGWGGACAAQTGPQCVVPLTEARLVRATFLPLRRLVVVADSGDGRGHVMASVGAAGLDCRVVTGATSGACAIDVVDGREVDLIARGDSGAASLNVLAGWGGDCSGTRGSLCRLRLDSDRRVSVRFVGEPVLRVDLAGNGGGQVVAARGIACQRTSGSTSGVCERGAVVGEIVTLTAIPDANSTLAGWSGPCAVTGALTCVTTVQQALTVRATFVPRQVKLTLRVGGPRYGSVQVNGATACTVSAAIPAAECILTYDAGTALQLRGVAATGSRFVGFGDDCTGPAPCFVTIVQDRIVSAAFDVLQATVTVQLTGTGSGQVTASGSPLCTLATGQGSVTCTRAVNVGTVLLLDAAPGSGSTRGAFSGGCTGNGPCALTVSRDVTVSLAFTAIPTVAIDLAWRGSGSNGTVALNGVLLCERSGQTVIGTCVRNVPVGTQVTLTVAPGGGSRLEGWGGACAGQAGVSCTFIAQRDESVTLLLGRSR